MADDVLWPKIIAESQKMQGHIPLQLFREFHLLLKKRWPSWYKAGLTSKPKQGHQNEEKSSHHLRIASNKNKEKSENSIQGLSENMRANSRRNKVEIGSNNKSKKPTENRKED